MLFCLLRRQRKLFINLLIKHVFVFTSKKFKYWLILTSIYQKYAQHLLGPYYALGAVLSTLNALHHLLHITTLWGRYCIPFV